MQRREIFLVKNEQQFWNIANSLFLDMTNVAVVMPDSNPDFLRGITDAVVWICDDWWQHGDIDDVDYIWQTIMCIKDVEFVNYDKQFNIASI